MIAVIMTWSLSFSDLMNSCYLCGKRRYVSGYGLPVAVVYVFDLTVVNQYYLVDIHGSIITWRGRGYSNYEMTVCDVLPGFQNYIKESVSKFSNSHCSS